MSTPERQQDPGQHGYGASSKTKRTLARNTEDIGQEHRLDDPKL